jgi:hypothetical protein
LGVFSNFELIFGCIFRFLAYFWVYLPILSEFWRIFGVFIISKVPKKHSKHPGPQKQKFPTHPNKIMKIYKKKIAEVTL